MIVSKTPPLMSLEGDQYFNPDNNKLYVYRDNSWNEFGKKEYWKIYSNNVINLSFWDRILVLFGKKLHLDLIIHTTEPTEVIATSHTTYVEKIKNPFKKIKGYSEITI
jgi:hypothetical protein